MLQYGRRRAIAADSAFFVLGPLIMALALGVGCAALRLLCFEVAGAVAGGWAAPPASLPPPPLPLPLWRAQHAERGLPCRGSPA